MDQNFKDWLLLELKRRGWTYRDLERHAGVSKAMTSYVLSGQRGISWDYCAAVARAFQVSPIKAFLIAGLLSFDELPFPSRLLETRKYLENIENSEKI